MAGHRRAYANEQITILVCPVVTLLEVRPEVLAPSWSVRRTDALPASRFSPGLVRVVRHLFSNRQKVAIVGEAPRGLAAFRRCGGLG